MKSLSLLSILLLEAITANIVSTEECNRDNIGAVRLTCPRNSNNEGAVQMCARFRADNQNSDAFSIGWVYLGPGGWNERAATVVCEQLGIPYTGVEAFNGRLPYNTPVINEAVNCNGEEDNLRDCFGPTISTSFAMSRDLPSVVCKCEEGGSIRLVDGSNYREGRVEVCVDGRWGTVCGEDWIEEDAGNVCEELGFSREVATLMRFGNGTGQIHTLTCSTSDDCTTTPAQNCHHGMDVGVRCLAKQDVVCATEDTNCSQMDVDRPTSVSDNNTTTGLWAITGLLSAALLAVVVGWIGSCVYLKRQMALVAIANRARVVPTTTSNETYGVTDGMMDGGTTANEAYGVTAGNEDADLPASGAYEITDIIARQSQSVELLDTKSDPYYSVIPE